MKPNPQARARVLRARELDRIQRDTASMPEPAPVARKLSRPRIGPRMRELRDIVSAMPGCSKSDALHAAGLPVRGMGSGRELNRAIAAGLVIVEHERANLCRLFVSERDRQRWHLRTELLTPGTPVDRIEEIRAKLEQLDRERALTWTEAS